MVAPDGIGWLSQTASPEAVDLAGRVGEIGRDRFRRLGDGALPPDNAELLEKVVTLTAKGRPV